MAYGDLPLDAPLKPNKGLEGGACNRQSCQAEPALFYNHGMDKWYCGDCARDIGEDWVNRRGWVLSPHYPGHPQFETREQIDARKAAEPPAPPNIDSKIERAVEPWFGRPLPAGRGKALACKPKSASLERLLGNKKRRARRI
jgi:hypothetical protein